MMQKHVLFFATLCFGCILLVYTSYELFPVKSARVFSPKAFLEFQTPQVESCQPAKNLVYVKTHKTGSTTLATILYRFGYNNNLSFLFTSKQPLGHFRQKPITPASGPDMYPPIGVPSGDYKNYKFNISAGHLIYHNRNIFDIFMSGHPKYITLIREPVKQFLSYFHFFGFPRHFMSKARVATTDENSYLTEFLNHPRKYGLKTDGPVYVTNRNPQLFDLGLPLQQMDNSSYIRELITQIRKDFDLVLIMEYLDESLILLKRQLCWEMTDIMYFKKNVRRADPREAPRDDLARKIRDWNSADALLYERFNQTLWRKIQEYGPTFQADLDEFRRRLGDMTTECVGGQERKGNSEYVNVLKANASAICRDVDMSIFERFKRIAERQKVPQKARNTGKPK